MSAPLAFVTVGELGELEIGVGGELGVVGGRVVNVDRKLHAVFPVQIAEHVQIKAIEKRRIVLLRNVAQEEAIVVDRKAIPRHAVAIPYDPHAVLVPAVHPLGHGYQVRLRLAQNHLGLETISFPAARHAVDGQPVAGAGLAGNTNRQTLGCLLAVPMVQDGPVKRFEDLHGGGRAAGQDQFSGEAASAEGGAGRGRLQNSTSGYLVAQHSQRLLMIGRSRPAYTGVAGRPPRKPS